MDKDYYCGTLVMKQHLSTSTYQKVDSSSDKRVFNNLKFLIKKHESCLTKNEMKYILNSNWKSSNFYVLPKIHKSKKIIEEINENRSICLNMQPPEDLKGRPIVGGPNSPTQGISGLLEKILTPIVSCLKTYVKDDWDFIRKLPSHVKKCKKSRKKFWMLQLRTVFPYGLNDHISVKSNNGDIHVLVGKRFPLLSINHALVTRGSRYQGLNVLTPE